MAITPSQRKQLEAMGYTVSKSGNAVLNKSGATVGGINANGQVYSGSSKVASVLKAKAETKPTAKSAAKPSTRTSTATKSKSGFDAPTSTKPILDKKPITRTVLKTSLPKAKELTDAEIFAAQVRGMKPSASAKSRPVSPTPATAYAAKGAKAAIRSGAPSASDRAEMSAATAKGMGARMGNYTKAEWQAMSLSERKAKGLPLRPIDAWNVDGSWKKG